MMRYLVLLVVVTFAAGWAGDVKKIDLAVSGMHCDHCAVKVKSALKQIQGVQDVQVNIKKGTAKVVLASTSVTKPEILAKAIADAGYGASYKEGTKTKTLAATKDVHNGDDCEKESAEGVDCAKEGAMNCCGEQSSKTKVMKKK